MQQSFAYVLNRRPFRDNSLLLDLFTEDYGRICCVARPAKKRGKILKGHTEPFRYLHIQWIGKGDVQTLVEADERGRHTIPASELLLGLYLNELMLLFTQQHIAQSALFNAYKYTLHKIGDSQINQQILMRFELYLIESLGYSFDILNHYEDSDMKNKQFAFTQDSGLQEKRFLECNEQVSSDHVQTPTITMSRQLLLALQDIQNMQESQWMELRVFLDRVLTELSPREIKTRSLLTFN